MVPTDESAGSALFGDEPAASFGELPPAAGAVVSSGTRNVAPHCGHLPRLPACCSGQSSRWPLGQSRAIVMAVSWAAVSPAAGISPTAASVLCYPSRHRETIWRPPKSSAGVFRFRLCEENLPSLLPNRSGRPWGRAPACRPAIESSAQGPCHCRFGRVPLDLLDGPPKTTGFRRPTILGAECLHADPRCLSHLQG